MKDLEAELRANNPEPRKSMMECERKEESIEKYKSRKQLETAICPPTCSGNFSTK